jgi:multiple antibiotic resistance protein
MDYLQLFIKLCSMLFIIIDPIGYSLVFFSLTKDYDEIETRTISYKAPIYSFFIILFYVFVGKYLLELIHVSMSSMKITGGIFLLYSSYMIMKHDNDSNNDNDYKLINTNDNNINDNISDDENDVENSSQNISIKDKKNIAIYPLATGILAGPGTICTIIILTNNLNDIFSYLTMISSLFVIYLLCFLGTLLSNYVKKINNDIIYLMNITIGLLLCSLSITFITGGLKEIFEI